MGLSQRARLDPLGWLQDTRILPRPIARLLKPLARKLPAQAFLLDPIAGLRQHGPAWLRRLARLLEDRRRRRNLAAIALSGEPLVSVIMPAHNAAATIEAGLKSLSAQSYDRLEILVVDDASEDDTPERVKRLACCDRRIRLLASPQRQGAALARNRGLVEAKGSYLTFQDADDWSAPDRIERQLAALLADRRALASLCAYRRVDPDGLPVTINGVLHRKRTISLLFPRDPVLNQLGGMAPLTRGEDSEYLARLRAAFGKEAQVFLFAPLYEAGFRPDSLLWQESNVNRVGNDIVYDVTETDPPELERFRAWHREIAAGRSKPYLAFAPKAARDDPPGANNMDPPSVIR